MDAASSLGMAITNPRAADGNRSDPGLHLALGHVSVADDAATTRPIDEIGMQVNESLYLRLHRLGQQPTGAGAQYLRQRVGNRNLVWMGKRNNRIFVHGVSFLREIGDFINRQDTPPSHHSITNIQLELLAHPPSPYEDKRPRPESVRPIAEDIATNIHKWLNTQLQNLTGAYPSGHQ